MENSLANYEQKAKGIFDQKGGTLGMVLLALGVVAFIWNINAIAAFATTLLGLIVTVVAIAAILFLAFNKDFRILVGTLYMMAIRGLMGAVIKMNPIAILEDTIKEMYKRIDNIEDKMGKLNGVRLKFKDKIVTKKKETKECLDSIEVFEKRRDTANDPAEKQKWGGKVIVQQRQSVRLVDITKEYIDLQGASENWYNTLSKIEDGAKLTVEDAENEVKMLKEKFEMVKDSHSAFKSMMSIMKGNPDELANFNLASDIIAKDIADKVGEMDRVLNSTGGMIDKMDTDKEILSIKGNDISKQYKELGIDSLFAKMDILPSTQVINKLQVVNFTPDSSPLQKSSSKYFSN
jgi:predicted  nucleic acid-binding Zn-ribbon protein